MHTTDLATLRLPFSPSLPLALSVALLLPLFFVAPTAHAATLTGNISNVATGNLLEGAQVAVPSLGLSTFTDNTGRYVLPSLPAGSHEVVVTYVGLDPARTTVTVNDSASTTRNFDLTSVVYKLDAFKVTGEREGGAAAITAQRNAENVKNIVAMDSFGNLPNMNAAEVAIRLPGVAGNPSDENLIDGFTIRGIGPGLNSVTLDGSPLTSQGALSRSTNMNNLTGSMFDQMELTKGHTPDKEAGSIGGTINLKSRSPLSMKERRRITYSAGVRYAPSFTEQTPTREKHRAHPLFNVGWQELFDVFGGERRHAFVDLGGAPFVAVEFEGIGCGEEGGQFGRMGRCHARCVLQRCTEPSARLNARTARAARMAFVHRTGLVRASQASRATGAIPA